MNITADDISNTTYQTSPWLLLTFRKKSAADSVPICCSTVLSFTLHFNNHTSAELFQTEVIKSKISLFAKNASLLFNRKLIPHSVPLSFPFVLPRLYI